MALPSGVPVAFRLKPEETVVKTLSVLNERPPFSELSLGRGTSRADRVGLRCNNNIQVAAELANTYKLPILVYPVSFMPPGTKAPIVWYGGENIAQSGGKLNGMISFIELADRFEVEGVEKQPMAGLLLSPKVNSSFESLKQSIKGK